jgi:ElaB/YqjD/DUF883 family membrane-anchored ribosome-binding protein
MAEILPEGTDHVVPGATGARASAGGAREHLMREAANLKDQAADKASQIRDQATDTARGYAEEGKARATGALDSVSKLIGDGASHVDEHRGEAYGDYARRAADAVSSFSDTLREKDVEELVDDMRDFVRKSPALAIGAAAAAGFVIARLIKAGSETLQETANAASADDKSDKEPVSRAARKAPSRSKPASDD